MIKAEPGFAKSLVGAGGRTPNNPIKKFSKDLNRRFSKDDMQMANRYRKRCSMPLAPRKTARDCSEVSPHTCEDGCHQKDSP